jgi:hypothetical protein
MQMVLMLQLRSKNSLVSQAGRVNSVARGRQQQTGNHTSTVTEPRADGCSDTSMRRLGWGAATERQRWRVRGRLWCAARTELLRRSVRCAHCGRLAGLCY